MSDAPDDDSDGQPFVGKITQKAILFGPDGDVLITRIVDRAVALDDTEPFEPRAAPYADANVDTETVLEKVEAAWEMDVADPQELE